MAETRAPANASSATRTRTRGSLSFARTSARRWRPCARAAWTTSSPPDGVEVKLAGVLIRIFEYAGAYQLDLDGAVRERLAYKEAA